jgi:hypothetical protein
MLQEHFFFSGCIAISVFGCDLGNIKGSDSTPVKAVPLSANADTDVAWTETKVTDRGGSASTPKSKSGSDKKNRTEVASYSEGEVSKRMMVEAAVLGGGAALLVNCIANLIDDGKCGENWLNAIAFGAIAGAGAGYITAVKTAEYQNESQRLAGLTLGARTELRAARNARTAASGLVSSNTAQLKSLVSKINESDQARQNLIAKIDQSEGDLKMLRVSVDRIEEQRRALSAQIANVSEANQKKTLSSISNDLLVERNELQKIIDLFLGEIKNSQAAIS